jgi:hypothetical protein
MDLNYSRVGRLLHNMTHGDRRRANDERDRRWGFWDFQKHGLVEDAKIGDYLSIQRYVDRRRKDFDVRSCLIQLDNYHLLPKRRKPFTHYTDQMHSAPFRNLRPVEWAQLPLFDPQNQDYGNFDHFPVRDGPCGSE